MSKAVYFTSFRPLDRAENIHAIYNAYHGEKKHIDISQYYLHRANEFFSYNQSAVTVTDDFPDIMHHSDIMIWHGIQGGKKIGLDVPGNPYYHPEIVGQMRYVISASRAMVPVWAKCTGLPESQILPLGMPRTDQYFGKHKGDGKTMFGDPRKKFYLLVPTFRDRGETPFPDIDWDYIDTILNDDEILGVKMHPWNEQYGQGGTYEKILQKIYRHIHPITGDLPSAPFLYDADVVITDYSSIMFDALLLSKPIVLFEKNHGYTKSRGMYLRYPHEYTPFYAYNEGMLIDMMRYRYSDPRLTMTEETLLDTVADKCDGHACERICKLIDQLKDE